MAAVTIGRFLLYVLILGTIGLSDAQKSVIELDENNWTQMLTGEWMVEFFAPWCPACKGLEPVWKDFATWSKDLDINVAQVDVTKSPGLSGRFMVTALPTIFHVINGEFRQYRSARAKEEFISFVEDKKWKGIDPIPGWKSPGSYQMSIVSSFFKFSQMLRNFHTHLMEEYGMPTWGSYLILAVATILLGAILGLILVCILDYVYPQRVAAVRPLVDKEEDKKNKSDELSDDEIGDDLLDDASPSEGEDKRSESEGDVPKSSPTGSPRIKKRKPRRAD